MKLHKSIFVIILLLFSTSLVVGGDSSSTSIISDVENSSLTTGNEPSVVNNYQSNNPLIEFVIFAENNEEFSLIKQMDSIRVYNNLQAIVVKQSTSDYDMLKLAMPGMVFLTSAFNSFKLDSTSLPADTTVDNSLNEQIEIDINGMWDAGYNGTGVNVAVFDDGVSQAHPALLEKVTLSQSFLIEGYPDICRTHGTWVAGTIAGTGDETGGTNDPALRGSAFGASLTSVTMGCTTTPEGEEAVVGDFLAAFDWLIANNATIDVVNMSWGGGSNNFEIFIKKLAEVNIVSLSSAGNDGPEPFTISGGPGQAADTITVGASSGTNVIPGFSSRGPIAGFIYKPELIAPGYEVLTTASDGSYQAVDGTSFSSPITAGAVATIISALRANSIPYNPGLIKAVLMNNATDQGYNEISQGRGRIQTYASWLNILNADVGNDSIPMAVDMMPRSGSLPYAYMKTLFKDLNLQLPFTLVSSHAGLTKVNLTGSIKTIMSFDPLSIKPDLNSQYLYLDINTTGVAEGVYDGDLIVTLGSKATVTAHYSITVSGVAKAKALFDQRHTWWDSAGSDVIGGSNTGKMIELALSKGIWVVEYAGEITSQVLSGYDILWMPDPFGRSYGPDDDPVAEIMTPSEITAITDFVNSGGKLLVDFNGKFTDPEYGYQGTNATEANRLLANFDILASENAIPTPSGTSNLSAINSSSPVGAARFVSHFGNYLSVSGDARGIVGYAPTISTAIYDQLNGSGRVLVASTNFWMDNKGLTTGYGGDDKIFAANVWDWFTAETQVKFISSSIIGTTVKGQFKVLENGVPILTTPVVKRLGNSLLASLDITPVDIGGDVWEFTFDATDQGIHRFQVAYGDDYAAWEITVDTMAPSITNIGSIVNGSSVSSTSSIFLSFKVIDNISTFGRADIEVLIDGNELSSEARVTYDEKTFKLNIILHPSGLTGADDHVYVLTISVADEEGNLANYSFHFSLIFEEPGTTSPTTSSGITTPTTSTSDETETPYSIVFTVLSFFSIALIIIRRKNK